MSVPTVHFTERDEVFISLQSAAREHQHADDVLRAGLRFLKPQAEVESRQFALLRQLAKNGFDALDQGQELAFEDHQDLAVAVAQIGLRSATPANP